jgi:putative transposase
VDHDRLGAGIVRDQDPRQGRGAVVHEEADERYGSAEAITTDGLRSYKAAMIELGDEASRRVGR